MNPLCQVDINRPECQEWMIRVNAKCRELLGSNAPNKFSMWWLYDTPSAYKDVDLMTSVDCHKLNRELLAREVSDYEEEADCILVKAIGFILAGAAIIAILILLLSGIRWKPRTKSHADGAHREQQKGPPGTPQLKKKKRWTRGGCRLCFLHSNAHIRRQELKTDKQVAVHIERSQRKLTEWTKARERNARLKKEKLERRQRKEYDRIHEVTKN